MSTAELIAAPPVVDDPLPRRWTRDEYYQMYDAGMFQDQRVQLIEGEIVQMSPMKVPHARGVELVGRAMRTAFGDDHWVRIQLPLFLSDNSEPEPDIAVIAGSPRDHTDEHPRTALLIVEVSDSTLRFDRFIKRRMYAAANIPEYWIVNLVDRQVEVYRQPNNGDYREELVVAATETISPQVIDAEMKAADLLP